MSCDCGTKLSYEDCCGPFHAGTPAPTPQALMRSRYTAYARGLYPYVLATWHPSTRPADIGSDGAVWVRLEVKRFGESGDEGLVEFVAISKLNGRAQRMKEVSRFVREGGRWFYVSAT
jgi:SEC-C motif domain protein